MPGPGSRMPEFDEGMNDDDYFRAGITNSVKIAEEQEKIEQDEEINKFLEEALNDYDFNNDGNPDRPKKVPLITAPDNGQFGSKFINNADKPRLSLAGQWFDKRKRDLNIIYDFDKWEKLPFVFQLGRTFKRYEDMLIFTVNGFERGEDGKYSISTDKTAAHNTIKQICQAISPEKYMRLNCADTALGGNDAINCYPQFGEDDDIVHLMTATSVMTRSSRSGQMHEDIPLTGMGRVYMETYDSYQKIMWISVGVTKFANLLSFYQNAVDKDMADLLHGTGSISAKTIAGALVTVALAPIYIMTAPFRYFYKLCNTLKFESVTRYYDFWSDMFLYFKYVNTIVQHVSINLGLYPGASVEDQANGITGTAVTSAQKIVEQSAAESRNGANPSLDSADSMIPDFFKYGADIFSIMSRRSTYINTQRTRYDARIATADQLRKRNTNHYFSKLAGRGWGAKNSDETGVKGEAEDSGIGTCIGNFISNVVRNAWNSATGSDKFIGFRIEKSTDSNETLHNETGASSLASTMNQKAQAARDAMFTSGLTGDAADRSLVGGMVQSLGSMASSIGSLLTGGASDAVSNIMITGESRIDIPDIWTGSSFSKSYHFNMTLRDPFGANPISYVQRIIVPLACILAMGLPRSSGTSSYGSPFYIRAFCKGMFAVPLGMIENISITRGAAEHGWSIYNLPTVVQVSFGLKDLGTVMHMAMNQDSLNPMSTIMKAFSANSTFQEYLLTLSSVGHKERTLIKEKLRRNWETYLRMRRSTIGNSNFIGMWLGQTTVGQVAGAVSKFSGLPS